MPYRDITRAERHFKILKASAPVLDGKYIVELYNGDVLLDAYIKQPENHAGAFSATISVPYDDDTKSRADAMNMLFDAARAVNTSNIAIEKHENGENALIYDGPVPKGE